MRAISTMMLRLLALVGKELVEVIRRPGALVSLVFGPFLIMAVFGLGYNGERRPLENHCALPGRIAGVSVNARLRGRQKRRGSRAAHLPRRSAAGTLFSDAAQFLANSLVKTIRSGRIQRRRCRR